MYPTLSTSPLILTQGVLLIIGFSILVLHAQTQGTRVGIAPRAIRRCLLLGLPTGFLAAKVGSVFLLGVPAIGVAWNSGYSSIAGGLGFLLATLAFSRGSGIGFRRLLDVLAPGLALMMVFARIGCFSAGCCWGSTCVSLHGPIETSEGAVITGELQEPTRPKWPLAVRYGPGSLAYRHQVAVGLLNGNEDQSLPVHPVQLYEGGLVLCLWVILSRRRQDRPGKTAMIFVVGYAAVRFFTEALRADSAELVVGLTPAQVAAGALIPLCALSWWIMRATSRIVVYPPEVERQEEALQST